MTTAQGAIGTAAAEETRGSVRIWTLISLVVFLLSLVFWVGFMTAGGVFYTLSDGSALLMAAAMTPVMVGYDTLLRPSAGRWSAVAKWIGLTGMALAGAGSVVLLTSEVSHQFVPAGGGLGMQFLGFGLEGVWFILVGWMASRSGTFSGRVAKVCYLAGAGFVLGVVGSPSGPDHPLVATGGAVSLIGFVMWAIWSRRELA